MEIPNWSILGWFTHPYHKGCLFKLDHHYWICPIVTYFVSSLHHLQSPVQGVADCDVKKVRKGLGRGRPLKEPSFSSSDLSTNSSLSLEEDLAQLSVTQQLEKSSDESVLSLTLPPVPQQVAEYLPPQPRLNGLFPGKVGGGSLKTVALENLDFTLP